MDKKIFSSLLPGMSRLSTDDGWYLLWDIKTATLDLEFYDNGKMEWFFRNRETKEVAGGEDFNSLNEFLGDRVTYG